MSAALRQVVIRYGSYPVVMLPAAVAAAAVASSVLPASVSGTPPMSDCGCHHEAKNAQERKILTIALILNATMAVVGGIAGWIGESTGLLADALDMLSDATAYAIGLVAIGRAASFKANAAMLSGAALLLLGLGVLFEVGRRVIYGAEPVSGWMIGTAIVSLIVNMSVLHMLAPLKSGEVHLRATWIFTRADIVANVGVVLAGVLVFWLRSPIPDYVIGTLIGLYVVKEAGEILVEARRARRGVPMSDGSD